jgi:hypothetical protein
MTAISGVEFLIWLLIAASTIAALASGGGYRHARNGLNPRFPPTIIVSATTSQVLRRPPEVT